MKKILLILIFLVTLIGLSANSYAGTVTTTFDVNVNVVPACSVTATGINFPDYDGSSTVDANGDVTVTCSLGIPYNIALDAGLHVDGLGRRQMSDGINTLIYALFKPTGQEVWGDSDFDNTYPGGTSFAVTGSGAPQGHQVLGSITPGSTVPPGAYSDTITVTVHY
jgi:spore coat protein U-like protein